VERAVTCDGLTLRSDQMTYLLCSVCREPFSLTTVRYQSGPFHCPNGHLVQARVSDADEEQRP
jgi:hypothetical protein